MKQILLSLLIAVGLLQAAESLDLEQAMLKALTQNASVLQAKNNTAIYENNAIPGNAGLLPRVTLNASANYTGTDLSAAPGQNGTQQTNSSLGVNASQVIFSGLGNAIQYRILTTRSEYARWQERYTIENTLLNVSVSWYNMLAAKENVKIAGETLEISRERLLRSEEAYRLGGGYLNYLNAQVDLASDSLSLLTAESLLADRMRSLNRLMGEEPSLEWLIPEEKLEFGVYDKTVLREKMLSDNSYYRMSLLSLKESELNVRSALSSYSPIVTLSGSYGITGTNYDGAFLYDDPVASHTAALTLSLPLFSGNQRKIQSQNARISEKSQMIHRDDVKLQLIQDLESAYADYQTDLLRLKIQTASLEAAQFNFDQSSEKYQLGQLTASQFREAQLNLLSARIRLNQAKYSAKMNENLLLQLTGQILRGDR